MKILYVAMAHEYGRPERGPSFEEMSFRSAFEGMGHEVDAFDFAARQGAVGRERMNAELAERAAESKPDVAFFFLFEDEIAPETIRSLECPTVNWFADDHWRFESFTRRYAPAFDWAVTTDRGALPKYRAIGCDRVMLSQWAVNRYAYSKTAERIEHDVTFVGQPHGDRREVVARLGEAGFEVECFGTGWPNGRIGHDDMVRLFGSSAVNLNLSNSSPAHRTPRARFGALVRGRFGEVGRGKPRPSQIKGRTFEVPGSGGFLLTDRVPYLEDFFMPGEEIGVFTDADDLVEQVAYWLAHPDERAAVAEAGYRRARAEHTYDHRFAAIFAAMGLG